MSSQRRPKTASTARDGRPLPSTPRGHEVPDLRVRLIRARGLRTAKLPSGRAHAPMASIFARYIGEGTDREHFVLALLDVRERLLGLNTVSIGCATCTLVHPREVFKPAILASAGNIVVAHNHPSGDPEPSQDDLRLTRRLHAAGQLLGIELLDHIVIGANGAYVSLRARGVAVGAWPADVNQADPEHARRVARLERANSRRPPSPSATRAASLRAAVWKCRKCKRGQTQRSRRCRYCGMVAKATRTS